MSALEIERVRSTFLIKIRYTHPSPDWAAKVASAYGDEYILQKIESQFDALRHANTWIDTRLDVLRDEVRSAEEAAAFYRASEGLSFGAGTNNESFIEQRMESISQQLGNAKTNYSRLLARFEAVRGGLQSNAQLEPVDAVLELPMLDDLRREEAAINRQIAEARARYGERHPTLLALLNDQKQITAQIATETSRVVQSLNVELRVAASEVASLEKELQIAQKELAERSSAAVKLQELDRDLQAPRGVYEALLNRQRELNERDRLAEPDARIVARAIPPTEPDRPRKKILMAGGFVIALMLGCVAAFGAEVLDTRVRNTNDIRREFGAAAPVVLVPRVTSRSLFKQTNLDNIATKHVLENPDSLFADSMRELRMQLKATQRELGRESVAIAFTSTFRGEGRSTTAFSFAVSLASNGHRVAYLHSRHGEVKFAERAPASDLVGSARRLFERSDHNTEDDDRPVDLIATDDTDGASGTSESQVPVPTTGGSSGNQLVDISRNRNLTSSIKSEVLGTRQGVDVAKLNIFDSKNNDDLDVAQFSNFLDALREEYDYIIIDCPDLMSVTETSLMAGCADGIAYVVEWCETTRDALRVGVGRIKGTRTPIMSFVLSKADNKQRYYFRPEDRQFYYRRRSRAA